MQKIGVGEGLDQSEVSIEDEQLRIGGHQYALRMIADAAQAAIAAPPGNVDVGAVPIQFQVHRSALEIDQVQPTMAVAEQGATNDGRG